MMRRRSRSRMAFLLVLGLLLQQLSMVAYACAVVQLPVESAAMVEACVEMGKDQQVPDSPLLCEKHCNPDRATVGDHVKVGVPALALPPLVHVSLLAHAASTACLASTVAVDRSDPPPRLRYCRLLI